MTAAPPRLLVLDLDGTAITRDGRVVDADRAAAGRLRAIGVDLSIATGRLWPGTAPTAAALGIDDGVAVMNGSEHRHAASGRVLHRWSIDPSSRLHLRAVLHEHALHSFLFAAGAIHLDRRADRYAPFLRIWAPEVRSHDDIATAAPWEQDDDLLGVSAVGPRDRVEAARAALQPLLHPDLGFVEFDTPDGQRFLEVRHRHEDKATALARLAADRGLGLSDVVAVGDWINDVTMLHAAGLGFAMDGAAPEAVAAADAVLPARRGHGGAIEAVAKLVWGV
jgi:hydroxymethylpyrimidine pyrophosphatase-like HAD family hydrolase